MKFNSYVLLGVLTLLITLAGCEEYEEIGEVPTRETHVHAETVSFSELQNQTQIRTQLHNISLNQSVNNDLSAKSNMSGMTIDTTQIKVITYAQTHTYTFRLKRDVPFYYIENIVLHYNLDTQQYDEYLIQYDVSAEDYVKIDQGLYHETDPNVLITRLQNGTFADLQKSGCEPQCTTVMVPCTGGGHEVGENCCVIRGDCPNTKPPVVGAYVYQSCQTVCGGNTDEDEDLDDGTPNNGGGAPPPADEDVLTNPNNYPPCIDEGNNVNAISTDGCYELEINDQIPDPIEQELNDLIKKDTTFVKVKDIINQLRTKTSETVEYSMSFYKSFVDTSYVTKPRTPAIERGPSLTRSYIYTGRFDFGSIHTHPVGTHAMFSFRDIFTLHETHNTLGPDFKDDAVIMIVSASGDVYALKVTDITKLNNELNAALNTVNGINRDTKIDNLTIALGRDYDNNMSDLKGVFTSKFKNFGISLYKANDINLSGWTKIN
ncbi:hypothetical protein BST97_09435 [Nonlabens spongiae]|uniref:Uncharacterized protein n=1 Tax=Nonlabens spongiae TaxID=331648 RepID=A0A1W6ML21_9FLAO|nr:hypothetical protein [Nonlabens spongiae]ARN78196.1 hypothetical protein BST97_09435 [Nonlabens spongiae]